MIEQTAAARLPLGLGIIVGAVTVPFAIACAAGLGPWRIVADVRGATDETVAAAVTEATAPWRSTAVDPVIEVTPPSSAATVASSADGVRWEAATGDFVQIQVLSPGSPDPFAGRHGARVIDVVDGRRADGTAVRTATVRPDRAADSGMLRVALLRLQGRRIEVVARTDAGHPDAVVLADFERAVDSLRLG